MCVCYISIVSCGLRQGGRRESANFKTARALRQGALASASLRQANDIYIYIYIRYIIPSGSI